MSAPKRLSLRHGNFVRVWAHANEPYELGVITAHNGSCLMVVEEREEMIAIADAILAVVKEQDEARAAVAAPDTEVNALIDGPCTFEEGA